MGRASSSRFEIDAEGDFEALVTGSLFARVQSVLSQDPRKQSGRKWNHPDFPLRRHVKCGTCSHPITGSWSKGRSKSYPYYRCSRLGCGSVNMRKEELETQFSGVLRRVEADAPLFSLLAAIVEDALKDHATSLASQNARTSARINHLLAREQKLNEAFIYDKAIDKSTYMSEQERLRTTIDEARQSLVPELPFEFVSQVMGFAKNMISDLIGHWSRANPDQRDIFLSVVFPAGLVVDGGHIRTVEKPWFFQSVSQKNGLEEHLVAPTGFEPALPA